MTASPRVAAVVLAAGRGTRMPERDKLLAPVGGRPLFLHAVDAVLASPARPVLVVVGHRPERLVPLLAGRAVSIVFNPDHARGLGTSVRAGVAALPPGTDGALFLPADMPRVRPEHIELLLRTFGSDARRPLCVPTHAGRRGNPVLWPARLFAGLRTLQGDAGGRALFERYAGEVTLVEMPDPGILIDIDVAADLVAAGGSVAPGGEDPAQ